jgi:hypothetical protein
MKANLDYFCTRFRGEVHSGFDGIFRRGWLIFLMRDKKVIKSEKMF